MTWNVKLDWATPVSILSGLAGQELWRRDSGLKPRQRRQIPGHVSTRLNFVAFITHLSIIFKSPSLSALFD